MIKIFVALGKNKFIRKTYFDVGKSEHLDALSGLGLEFSEIFILVHNDEVF